MRNVQLNCTWQIKIFQENLRVESLYSLKIVEVKLFLSNSFSHFTMSLSFSTICKFPNLKVEGMLIGLYLFPDHLTREIQTFFKTVCLDRMSFLHDAASPRFRRGVKEHLNKVFRKMWKRQNEPISGFARFPDLTLCNFFV